MDINVVIVDDQNIVRLGVRQLLDNFPHINLLGDYSDIFSFCQSAAAQQADVILLDDSLAGMDVIRAHRTVQKQCPSAAVLFLSSQMSAHDIHRVLDAGAWGVIFKNDRVQDILVLGIEHVYTRQVYLSANAALLAGRIGPSLVLTPRLDQVLHMVARGYHVEKIAREAGITTRAVYNARKRLREILEVETNEQLVAEAVRRNLLRNDE